MAQKLASLSAKIEADPDVVAMLLPLKANSQALQFVSDSFDALVSKGGII